MSTFDFRFPVREVIKVIDGDSQRLMLDVGFKTYKEIDLRVIGIDTPEKRGDSKEAGLAVKRYVSSVYARWMATTTEPWPRLLVFSHKLDKYGRVLGDVKSVVATGPGESLSEMLLRHGLAKPYDGGKKNAWTAAECREVLLRVGKLMGEPE